jgi:hypothetical protein
MKCDIIRKTIFLARDKDGKEYEIKNDQYHSFEEIEHKDVEGVCSQEEILDVEDRSYTIIPIFEIKKSN